MNLERWPLLISIFILASLGIYYLSSILTPRPVGEKSPSNVDKLLARQPTVEGATALRLPEARPTEQLVDERALWRRNPFLTEEEEARARGPEAKGLKIKAIIVGPPRSVATVDGQTVLVGEKIREETVLEIREDAVVLQKGGRKRVIKLREPSISIQVKDERK